MARRFGLIALFEISADLPVSTPNLAAAPGQR